MEIPRDSGGGANWLILSFRTLREYPMEWKALGVVAGKGPRQGFVGFIIDD